MARFTNTFLLVLLVLLGLSGILMLYGTWLPWVFDLHRMSGFALLALFPWKSVIIYRSLARGLKKTFDRSIGIFASLAFAAGILVVVTLSLLWLGRSGPFSVLFQTLIAWHWILGLLLLPLFALHVWRRWPRPRMADITGRRDFLKFLGIAAFGVIAGWFAASQAEASAPAQEPLRFTGSRGYGIFSGNDFPLTGEATQILDVEKWRLQVTGAVNTPLVLTYQELLSLPVRTLTETLDCTSGWYSLQHWQGIPVLDLIKEAGLQSNLAGVRLVSVTGYQHTFPIEEARNILLATHVSGETLEPRHGFPLRAVVPGRRGWFWVKWLVRVDALDDPSEVALGMLLAPREVLRQW